MCSKQELFLVFNLFYDDLESLESIVTTTKSVCMDKELSSNYLGLSGKEKISLSAERNHYINLLSIALDKIESLKMKQNEIEEKIISIK